MTDFMKLIEIVGTVAFAVSGALVAIGADLDLFGVVFVSCITAFGGGILRDLLLGIHPPVMFMSASARTDGDQSSCCSACCLAASTSLAMASASKR